MANQYFISGVCSNFMIIMPEYFLSRVCSVSYKQDHFQREDSLQQSRMLHKLKS